MAITDFTYDLFERFEDPIATIGSAGEFLMGSMNALEAFEDNDLEKLLRYLTNGLSKIYEAAQDFAPDYELNPSMAKEILRNAHQSYGAYLDPIVSRVQGMVAEGPNGGASAFLKLSMILTLSIEVYKAYNGIYNNLDKMNNSQRLQAAAGAILMFSGTAMLIASAVNPAIKVSVYGVIAIVTAGCYLARRALDIEGVDPKTLPSFDGVLKYAGMITKVFNPKGKIPKRIMKACGLAENDDDFPEASRAADNEQQDQASTPDMAARVAHLEEELKKVRKTTRRVDGKETPSDKNFFGGSLLMFAKETASSAYESAKNTTSRSAQNVKNTLGF